MAAAAGVAVAHPGMNKMMQELVKRQNTTAPPVELIGDLATVGAQTDTGKAVFACLSGNGVNCDIAGPKVRLPRAYDHE
jgi:hypothetical protein